MGQTPPQKDKAKRVARLRHLANGGEPYLLSGVCKSADIIAVCTALEQAEAECDTIAGNARELHLECQAWEESSRSTHLQLADAMKRVNELEVDRTKRICGCESRTGWTAIKCCNVCGLPLPSEPWRFPVATATTATDSDRAQRDAEVLRWAAKELCTSDDYGNLEVDDRKLIAMADIIQRGEVVIP
jgi:hypothetical protein